MEIQRLIIFLQMCIYHVFCRCTVIQNTTFHASEIFLTDHIADVDYARVTLFKSIDCCATNYSKMLWYFQKTGDSTWQPYPWTQTNGYELRYQNQTLEIKRIGLNDEGVYKCVAFSAQNGIAAQHNTTLYVYSCTDRIKPEAYGPTDKFTNVGQKVTFTCTGDFGCNSDSTPDVSWYDEKWELLSDKKTFPRYEIITIKRAGDTIVESNFTIKATTEEDFLKTFRCVVASSHTDGHKTFNCRLKKTSVNIRLPPYQIAAVGTAVLVVLVFTIMIVVLFYPRIKLFILSRLPYWHLDDIGNNEYHALILHEESVDDLELAREIKQLLNADSYRIILVGEILGGQSRLEMIQNYSNRSKSLIIIYPLDSYTIEFERSIGAQEYFQPNLITVVKQKTTNQKELQCLDDVALVKLIYPKHVNCSIYKQKNFFCELKLRICRGERKTSRYCCEPMPNITRPETLNVEQLPL